MENPVAFSKAAIVPLFFAILGAGLLTSPGARSQDAELNPVPISGTFSFGTEELKSVAIRAVRVGETGTATGNFSVETAGDVSIAYEVLVNVPAGGSADYDVQACAAQLETIHSFEQVCFPYERITVNDGEPASLDLSYLPAFVEGEITATGDTISYVEVKGSYHNGSYFLWPGVPNVHFRTQSQYGMSTDSWTYRLAVPPGRVEVQIVTNLTDSMARPSFAEEVTIAVGETAVVNIETAPPAGSVSGTITSTGSAAISRHYLTAQKGSVSTATNIPGNGEYQINYLADGMYNLFAQTQFGNGATYYYGNNEYDPGRSFTISGENSQTISVATEQAFIGGSIRLTESATNDDLTYARVDHRSISGSSSGATSIVIPALPSGEFDAVVSAGEAWRLNLVQLYINRNSEDPADNFLETIYVNFSNSGLAETFPITAGENLTRNYELPMGKATVRLTVAGGSELSDPQLSIGCSRRDDSGATIVNYSGSSSDTSQDNVAEGVVSFLAPEGSCWVDARARVGSAITSFSRIEDVVIEPGSDIVVENEGPRATISYPEPDITVSESPILVQGLAWDDGNVASVSVNGIDATLGTPDAEGKIPFEASVPLVTGENTIQLLVLDDTDKQLTITRTIYFEGSVPEDVTPPQVTPPADVEALATGELTAVDIGTATAVDDIDGELTPDVDDPGPYPKGETIVTWSATDIAGNTGTATQKVTIVEPYPFMGFLRPIANPPAINRARAGRTYPVKWQMRTGEDYLRDTGLVSRITVGPVPCDWVGEDYQASELPLGGRPGLRYDEDDEQYIYQWNTDRNLAGCHLLSVEFDDGSRHSALFDFR